MSPASSGADRQSRPPNVSWVIRWPAPKQSNTTQPENPRRGSSS